MADLVEQITKLRLSTVGLSGKDPHDYVPRNVSAGDCLEIADALEALQAEQHELRKCLIECSDELESHVEHHYQHTTEYPSERRRYDRDIGPVRRARAALK